MEKVKIITYYLPQYHELEINNKWWGKGFTEWVNVKKAKPLFDGHYQPKVPLEKNYYDLSQVDTMRWQAKLAQEYGVDAFCYYHYWFDDKPVMEKPLLNFLEAKDIDLEYCICWANESWTNSWAGRGQSVIVEQKYGDEETWRKHFNFLLPFFKDNRYIKEKNKPLLVIYRPYLFEKMQEMIYFWNQLAIENGFDGLLVASQRFEEVNITNQSLYDMLDYHIEYQPRCYGYYNKKNIKSKIKSFLLDTFNIDFHLMDYFRGPTIYDYDELWMEVLNTKPNSKKTVAGGFVSEDTTPRHARRGSVIVGATPEKFSQYMYQQLKHVEDAYTPPYMFIYAWNEWGEGAVLEPDEQNGYSYLEALRRAVDESDSDD